MQLTVEDNFSKKKYFSLDLNSFLVFAVLIELSGNSHQVRGKLTVGKKLLDDSLQGGIKNSRWLRRMGWSSFLLSEFRIHVELKD